MKVERKEKHPRSFFLIAETEEDRIIIEALRLCGNNAVDVHKIFADDIYEEMVAAPAKMNIMVMVESGDADYRACGCSVNRKDGTIRMCQRHQIQWENAFLRETVEVEFKVPCICGGLEAYMPSFDPETGHSKDCLVPALSKIQKKEVTVRGETSES